MVRQNGFALVEVVVALTLLSVALLGITASATLAGRMMREADADEQSMGEAVQVLDSLMLQRPPVSGSRQVGRMSLTWTVSTDTTGPSAIELTLTYPNGTALRGTTFHALSGRQ